MNWDLWIGAGIAVLAVGFFVNVIFPKDDDRAEKEFKKFYKFVVSLVSLFAMLGLMVAFAYGSLWILGSWVSPETLRIIRVVMYVVGAISVYSLMRYVLSEISSNN